MKGRISLEDEADWDEGGGARRKETSGKGESMEEVKEEECSKEERLKNEGNMRK